MDSWCNYSVQGRYYACEKGNMVLHMHILKTVTSYKYFGGLHFQISQHTYDAGLQWKKVLFALLQKLTKCKWYFNVDIFKKNVFKKVNESVQYIFLFYKCG